MRRATFAALMVATWAVLAVSCGSGEVSREEYGQELRSAMQDVEEAYADSGAVVEGAPEEAATTDTGAQLRAKQIALRDAANRLDSITAPDDLASAHESLVSGVRDMADAVDLLIDAQEASTSDPAEAKRLAREFATDTSFGKVEAAASKIQQAGVDAGL